MMARYVGSSKLPAKGAPALSVLRAACQISAILLYLASLKTLVASAGVASFEGSSYRAELPSGDLA